MNQEENADLTPIPSKGAAELSCLRYDLQPLMNGSTVRCVSLPGSGPTDVVPPTQWEAAVAAASASLRFSPNLCRLVYYINSISSVALCWIRRLASTSVSTLWR